MGWVRDRVVLGVVVVLVTACALAAAPAHADRAPGPATFGVAVWQGCMEPGPFEGPRPLACPRAHDPRYPATVGAAPPLFDVLVPENEMKMIWTQARRGQFDFRAGDRLARFAAERGLSVRGHTLVFGKAVPGWMAAPRIPEWTRASLLAELRRHVTTVMGHYRDNFPGVVRTWDVVNEPFDPDGTLHENLFSRVIGPDWIEQVFRMAREADPSARLLLNEFSADGPNAKQRGLFALVKDFRSRGVPIGAVGLQMHIGMDGSRPTSEERRTVMRAYGELGLDVEITELDVGVPVGPESAEVRAEERAAIFRSVAADCGAEPACTGLTVWGVADHHSWRGTPGGHALHDTEFRPKPALADVVASLSRGRSRAQLLRTAPAPAVVVRARQRARAVAAEGVRARVACPAAGTCRATLTLALRRGTKETTVARRTVPIGDAGRALRLRPTALGARRLRALDAPARAVLRVRVAGFPVAARTLRLAASRGAR